MAPLQLSKLVDDLAQLGLELTVTRFCDGSTRLNRWRTIVYWQNSAAADALWAEHVGDDQERIATIKSYLLAVGKVQSLVSGKSPNSGPA